ncbi:hypothetical protein B2G50_07550 [Leptospira interrogans serovar Canicola]|nr:hypothetical protein B2G50_07550 [Leptospira interrogans serovar Canicola]
MGTLTDYIYSGIYILERKFYTRTLSILFLYSFRSKNIRILSCFSKSSAKIIHDSEKFRI